MNDSYQLGLAAIVTCTVAAVALHRNWLQKRGDIPAVVKLTPWLLLLCAFFLWVSAAGVEFGIVYTLLCASSAIWLCILTHNASQAINFRLAKKKQQLRQKQPWSVAPIADNSGLLLVIIPVACFSSVMFCLALAPLIPVSEASRLVVAGFLFPVIWSLVILWCCADNKRWRPALIMVCIAGVAAAIGQV